MTRHRPHPALPAAIPAAVPAVGAVAAPMACARDEPLSRREMQCLQMAAMGMTDTRVALVLGISHNTVRFHLHNACLKLGAPNRCAAIYRAAKDNRI